MSLTSTKTFPCSLCNNTFSTAFNRARHVRQVHNQQTVSCPTCNKPYKRREDLDKHLKKCIFQESSVPKQPAVSRKRKPTQSTSSNPANKIRRVSYEVDPMTPPADFLDLIEEEDVREIFLTNWAAIRTRFLKSSKKVQDLFNFRMKSQSTTDFETQLIKEIFETQQHTFKIDLAYGFILRYLDTGDLRYYHSCQNNGGVLLEPHLITDKATFQDFLETIRNADILEWARQQRPNSKWVVEMVTNATFFVNKILNFPIGNAVNLPPFVLTNPGLVALQRDENHGFEYADNLCLFRCLALANGADIHALQKAADGFFHRYVGPAADKRTFPGISLEQILDVEIAFNVDINVYALKEITVDANGEMIVDEDDDETNERRVTAVVVRRSLSKYDKTMNVNLFDRHFRFIKDFNLYSKCFGCRKCGKLWKTNKALKRHESTCDVSVRHAYAGGVYHPKPTIFQELEDEGLFLDDHLKYYRFLAAFDLEAYMKKTDLPQNSEKQTWIAEHVPLSVSVCSNVPLFGDPVCFITDGDSKKLVFKMMSYLKEISEAAFQRLLLEYERVFELLDEKIREAQRLEPPRQSRDGKEKQHPLELLKVKLETWLKELPVFSFNGGKYDINLIKKYFIQCLLDQDKLKMTIKKNNNYMSLRTDCLNFLDVTNYLAPGFSYDKFLKAYQCSATKGFLPYEWIDDLEKLKYPSLPPHEVFHSSLKGENITKEDYQWCLNIWNENRMTCFREYVVWYNNRDVQRFIEAVEKLAHFYREREIDLVKDGISVPGLTMKYLFTTLPQDAYFTLYDQKNADLHDLVKSNIVGGPSIIFHRHHEVGETKLREREFGEEAKVCRGVLGFDANALYLHCLMQDMPTGWLIRRKAPDFKAVTSHKYGRMAMEWLEFVSARNGVEIRHQFNGKEKRVGARSLPVDGWCKATGTVYQFHGCFWHGHDCHLNQGKIVNEVRGKPMRELLEDTHKKSFYVKALGFDLVEMWECEWRALKKSNVPIQRFLSQNFIRSQNVKLRKGMTVEEILKNVEDGSIFGMVECDLQVPHHLRRHFSEMQPIFKNTCVSREDIGPHMQKYAKEHGYLQRPAKMLIGSYFGQKILLTTPLLNWYIRHGLVVTKIYQVIEYDPKSCFKSFGDNVSNARRSGDANPDQSIVADTMKLLGNSGYEKTVTNKEKHRNVKFVSSDHEASDLVNENSFRKLNQLMDTTYEIELNKKVIKLDLPLHIGFFVYQYAKLRMLEFYYDFIDYYVDRQDFQYIEMDTDSAYLALSAPNLEDVVKPERRRQFYEEWEKWLPAEACDAHKIDFVETKMNAKDWNLQNGCCRIRKDYDKRKPGLFKLEWQGDGLIGLCSKTYYCYGQGNKFSSKGLSKRQNNFKKEEYLRVIKSQTSGSGANSGFKVHNNTIFTYSQTRAGLSYFYPKRVVLQDGISTEPIDI